eukprot:scaffold24_cov341-Pavlova_lutheri.AAC.38
MPTRRSTHCMTIFAKSVGGFTLYIRCHSGITIKKRPRPLVPSEGTIRRLHAVAALVELITSSYLWQEVFLQWDSNVEKEKAFFRTNFLPRESDVEFGSCSKGKDRTFLWARTARLYCTNPPFWCSPTREWNPFLPFQDLPFPGSSPPFDPTDPRWVGGSEGGGAFEVNSCRV